MNRTESAAIVSALQAMFEALNALANAELSPEHRRAKVAACGERIARAKAALMNDAVG